MKKADSNAKNDVETKDILLIEDNEDDEVLSLLALKRGASKERVTVVRDGAEALEYLFGAGRRAGVPDLILLDLKLPKVDGFEILRRLRSEEETRDMPVVVLSSSKERRDMNRCYGLGASSYVRKPVNFEQFTRTVEHLKRYWLTASESPEGS